MIQKLTPAAYHSAGRKGPLATWHLSKSFLFDFAASPYAWKYRHDNGIKKEVTASMEWGSAVDCCATTPDLYAATVVFADAAAWTGKAAQLERQAMREAAAQSGGDRRRYASLLRNSGLPGLQTAAATEEAALQKEAESQSKIGKESADTEKTRAELARVQRQEAIQVIGALKTPEDAIAAIGASSDFTPQMKEQLLNQIQRSAAEGPAGFRDLQLRLVLALAAPDKQVASMQPDYKNAGGKENRTRR